MVKSRKDWGKMVVDSLDEEESGFDVLGVEGKGIANTPPIKRKKCLFKTEGTVDSGASQSVAPIGAAPSVKVVGSEGSRRGQHYISAGNERIPNIGEQVIHFTTGEGKRS
eukprot:10845877-Heterocapsa_arctica.AAC.1